MRYQQVPTDAPADPPVYDDVEAQDNTQRASQDSLAREFELMDVEEAPRGNRSTWRTALRHKMNTVQTSVLDPLAEGYAHLGRQCEIQLSRLGNPLIVKRFVYVVLVALVVAAITGTGLLPHDDSRQSGSFSDRSLLLDFAKDAVDMRSMEENLEYLSSMEHTTGTAGDLALARYVQTYFKQKGLSVVEFMQSESLLNFPEKITLAVEGDEPWDLTQQFNPYSKDGEAEGGILYVNYGRASDYEQLQKEHVDVMDAICLIKFGQLAESEKMLLAQHYGCKAVLFTSETDAFPDSAERRSVGITQFYPGDPLTPGWSSGVDSTRIDTEMAPMPKIPSVSLTWNQAHKLWEKLNNGIDFPDFNSGDKSLSVKLVNRVVYKEDHAMWNVLGKFQGKEQPDKAMIIGAARDAACKGAVNPDTGTVVMLELINVLNKLMLKFNWQPLRTIYFISWDSSEYNFGGVTELIERNVQEMRREATVYLDLSDAIAGDNLEISTTSLLKTVLSQYQDEYKFTTKKWDTYKNSLPFMGQGIPVMDVGYRGTPYPQFTCDDTFENFKKMEIDPDFTKHLTLVEFLIKVTLNIIDDPLLPFDMETYEAELKDNVKALEEYAKVVRPEEQYNFQELHRSLLSVNHLSREIANWRKAWREIVDEDSGVEPSMLTVHRWNWNNRLNTLEKYFLDPDGLPGREWYKNAIFGPQLFKPENDENWWSFPSIRDAIFFGVDVQVQIDHVAQLLLDGTKYFIQG